MIFTQKMQLLKLQIEAQIKYNKCIKSKGGFFL